MVRVDFLTARRGGEGERTVWRRRAENSSNVLEKSFNWFVIPDSRNPRPCTETASS